MRKCYGGVWVTLISLFVILFPEFLRGESATITATVGIATPLIVSCNSELFFGKLCPGNTNGTVVVTTSNTRYATGGVSIGGGSFDHAQFSVTGQPNAFYHINMVASPAVIEKHHDDDKCGCNSGGHHDDDDKDDHGKSDKDDHGKSDKDDHGKSDKDDHGKSDKDDHGKSDKDDHGKSDKDDHGKSDKDDHGKSDKDDHGKSDKDDHGKSDKDDHHSNSISSLQVVNLLSFSTTFGAQTSTGKIGHGGVDHVFVGGTLLVPTNAEGGSYSCKVVLTVSY